KESGVLIHLSTEWRPVLKIIFEKPRGKDQSAPLEINAEEFISVKGFKALGNQLTDKKIKRIELKEALPYDDQPVAKNHMEIEVSSNETVSASDDDSQITLDF
ncbi:MAG: DNA gyrase/topoisomerase IV subunit A, partial [Flavobacteriaceae bacterium]